MKHNNKQRMYFTKAGWTAFYTVSFIFLLMTNILQPRVVDDFAINNIIHNQGTLSGFISWYYHNWTGRLQNVAFFWLSLQSDVSFLLFGIINSFVFTGFIWLCTAVVLGRRPRIMSGDGPIFLFILFLMWFAIPTLSDCVIWKTGAICYLWPMFFFVLFILPYRFWLQKRTGASETPGPNPQCRRNVSVYAAYLLFGIWVGFSNEQLFSAIASLALLWFFYILRKKLVRKVPPQHFFGIAGLMAGGAVQLVSPGNYHRFSGQGKRINLDKFIQYVKEVYVRIGIRLSILIVVIALCFLFGWLFGKKPAKKNNKRRNSVWWAPVWIFASICSISPFLLLSDFAAIRTSFFPACFVALAAGVLVRPFACRTGNAVSKKVFLPAVPILIVLLLLDGSLGVRNMYAISREFSLRERLIETYKATGSVGGLEVSPITPNPRHTAYVFDIGNNPDNWINKAVAQYYDIDTIRLADNMKSVCSMQSPIAGKAKNIDLLINELFPFDWRISQNPKKE